MNTLYFVAVRNADGSFTYEYGSFTLAEAFARAMAIAPTLAADSEVVFTPVEAA